MTDTISKEKRSWVMSRIKSKDTKIEKLFEKFLTDQKISFEKHVNIIGNPDFVIPSKTAIFIDGDFWHGYRFGKKENKLPLYWKKKIRNNMERDKVTNRKLRKMGWKVIRIWEHSLTKDPKLYSTLKRRLNK